jgi:hypothetical protein
LGKLRQPYGQGDSARLTVVDNDPHKRATTLVQAGVAVQAVNGRTGERLAITTEEISNLSLFARLRLRLPATRSSELKIWAHQVLLTGDSIPLPAEVRVYQTDQTHKVDLTRSNGQVILPASGDACELEIVLVR